MNASDEIEASPEGKSSTALDVATQLSRRHFLQHAVCVAAAAAWLSDIAHAKDKPAGARKAPRGIGSRVDKAIEELLSRMTLEEKLGQLTQSDGRLSNASRQLPEAGQQQIRSGQIGSFLGISGAAYTRDLQRIAVEQSRLGIPLLFAEDVIHGFRTIFPVPLAEAASFDVDAVEKAARVAAVEATAHGLHWTFAPMVDVARDPRWGRVVEGSGEDPYLGSLLAAARVRGFQGRDLAAADTLLATAKHFAAYGAAEGGRDYNIADISQRTLHEIYLPPFRAALQAGVQSFMAAFNEIAGMPMHANAELIQGLLRDDWGFDGVMISDYNAVRELIDHGAAADPEAAGIRAMRAGVDLDMAGNIYHHDLPQAVRAGRLSESVIDEAVRRVLRIKHRLGLFEDPYRYCDEARERARTLTAEHREAARDVACKSMVLLKNAGGLLPLSRQLLTIAVIGPLADDRRAMLGSWIGAGQAEDAITPLEGIRAAVGPGTRVLYAKGADYEAADASAFADAERVAREADAVLLCIGERHDMSGEAKSRSSLDLPGAQESLARMLKATGKPLAVILFAGRPLSINWLAQHVPSILLAWFPGIEAGHALADVIFGDCNPAGRLPITFPRTVGQIPIYYAHKNTGRPASLDVENSSKYLDVPWTPLYPFGHGLSYTSFEYRDLRLSAQRIGRDGTLEAQVEVANTGSRAGDEVVQLYVRDDVASMTRPVKQLRGFQRIHLRPGERRRVTFTIGPEHLALCGPDLRPIVEPGTFTVLIGGSSAELIAAKFDVAAG